VKTHFKSKWTNRIARIAITLGALGLFFLIRHDIFASASSRVMSDYQRKVVTPRLISEYMQRSREPKLQVGSGVNSADGWLNTDIEPTATQAYVDITERLPFRDMTIQKIFGEQVIEHVTQEQGLGFFKEAHRVLAPGGKLRLITPNLLSFVALFSDQKPATYMPRKLDFHYWPADTPDPACTILNGEMRSWGHQFVYTPKMLRASLEKAGFAAIRQYATGETEDADFRAVEVRARTEWKDLNDFDSMAFEATR
jgi:predicted SAM-dependent methyltransferase